MASMRENIIPAFYQVSETIRRRIELGVYPDGTLIPSEKLLEKEFLVSNITIRKALDILTQEGLLQRTRGVGTRVQQVDKHPLQISITGSFRDWFDSASGKSPKLEVEVLDMGLQVPPERISKIFQFERDQKLWHLERIQRLDQENTIYVLNYALPERLMDYSVKSFKENRFLEELMKQYGKDFAHIEQKVTATIADIELSKLLGVRFGAPLFFAENIYRNTEHSPLAVSHLYYRGDCYMYTSHIDVNESQSGESAPTKV